MTTSWIWQEGDYTRALNLDADKGVLLWHEDLPGFCAFAPREQALADFIENGPARFGSPPDDVLAEVQAAVSAVQNP